MVEKSYIIKMHTVHKLKYLMHGLPLPNENYRRLKNNFTTIHNSACAQTKCHFYKKPINLGYCNHHLLDKMVNPLGYMIQTQKQTQLARFDNDPIESKICVTIFFITSAELFILLLAMNILSFVYTFRGRMLGQRQEANNISHYKCYIS